MKLPFTVWYEKYIVLPILQRTNE